MIKDSRIYLKSNNNLNKKAILVKPISNGYHSAECNNIDTQILLNETVVVLSAKNNRYLVQIDSDNHIVWINKKSVKLTNHNYEFTHLISSLSAYIYKQNSFKSAQESILFFNTKVNIVEVKDEMGRLETGGWIMLLQVKEIQIKKNISDVITIFESISYGWGGKTVSGIDCSGLVQSIYKYLGINLFRDADLQEWQLSNNHNINSVSNNFVKVERKDIQKGDIICWDDHIAIAIDNSKQIHATKFYMSVVIESIDKANSRSNNNLRCYRVDNLISN